MWGAAPCEPIRTIFGTVGHLVDVINCAKFHVDRSWGFSLGGARKTPLPSASEVVLNTV